MNEAHRRKKVDHTVGERRKSDVQRITETLEARGRVLLKTYGSSMQPWMRPGDISLVRKTAVETVLPGDLVLFRKQGRLFLHRVVQERFSDGIREISTKGDAHPEADGWIGKEELLGRVAHVFRGARQVKAGTAPRSRMGQLIAQVSLWSRFWYPAARLAAHTSRPMRRRVSNWLSSTPASN
jgi:signal peptidase I